MAEFSDFRGRFHRTYIPILFGYKFGVGISNCRRYLFYIILYIFNRRNGLSVRINGAKTKIQPKKNNGNNKRTVYKYKTFHSKRRANDIRYRHRRR